MCGRFSVAAELETVRVRFCLARDLLDWNPRYNIAPTQKTLTITNQEGAAHANLMTWGLIPHWSKDKKSGYQMINARAETLTTKRSFKHCLKSQRCLVVADGFYEWKQKTPFRVILKDQGLFAFAGLWDTWHGPEGEIVTSFTIITVPANILVAPLHDRMPAILTPEAENLWLDPKLLDPIPLLQPFAPDQMSMYEVSPVVNSWKNDTPECVAYGL